MALTSFLSFKKDSSIAEHDLLQARGSIENNGQYVQQIDISDSSSSSESPYPPQTGSKKGRLVLVSMLAMVAVGLIVTLVVVIPYATKAGTTGTVSDISDVVRADDDGVFVHSFAKAKADDYYRNIDTTLTGTPFQQALFKLISSKTTLSYDDLWDAFRQTDMSSTCPPATLADIYSARCWISPNQQCGSYKTEGDCYNREHGWPKAWWGGFDKGQGAQTDLFHIYPTDGYDNGRRSDYPLGEVPNPTYTTSNGGKLGPCSYAGYSGICWEPQDSQKGRLARSYFYVSTAYMNVFKCCDDAGVNGSQIKPWLEEVLKGWHNRFPPSDEERQRNEIIFTKLQKNRNPFIDHPEWVDKITDF